MLEMAKEGLRFLKEKPLVLHVILFMSGVNLIASAFDAVLPALVIPRSGNSTLGIVTSCSGIAMVLGWLFVPVMSANQNVIMRNTIPVELQGRVYAYVEE